MGGTGGPCFDFVERGCGIELFQLAVVAIGACGKEDETLVDGLAGVELVLVDGDVLCLGVDEGDAFGAGSDLEGKGDNIGASSGLRVEGERGRLTCQEQPRQGRRGGAGQEGRELC